MPAISIIIPIYNEIEKLPLLMEQLEPYKYKNQIIIVNDGSEDGSKKILDCQKNLKIIHHSINLGKGAAIRTALKAVKEDIVMTIDGDLEIGFDDIKPLIHCVKKNQIIVGYRISKENNFFSINEFGSSLLNLIFNIIFSSSFRDILCCIKIMPTTVLKSFNLQSTGFDLETEIMANICIQNLKPIQKGVNYFRRTTKDGKKLRISDSALIIRRMITFRYRMFSKNGKAN
jgi:glycosyltransferase involved in cell wall biosynthesis